MAGTQPRTVPARGADPEGRGDSEGDRSRRGGEAPAGTEEAPQTHGRHPLSTLLPAARPAAASPLARLAGLLHRRPDPARDRRAVRAPPTTPCALECDFRNIRSVDETVRWRSYLTGLRPVGRDRPGSGGTDAVPVQQHRGQRPRPDHPLRRTERRRGLVGDQRQLEEPISARHTTLIYNSGSAALMDSDNRPRRVMVRRPTRRRQVLPRIRGGQELIRSAYTAVPLGIRLSGIESVTLKCPAPLAGRTGTVRRPGHASTAPGRRRSLGHIPRGGTPSRPRP